MPPHESPDSPPITITTADTDADADGNTPPPVLQYTEETINGSRLKRFVFTPADLARYFDGQDPYSSSTSASSTHHHHHHNNSTSSSSAENILTRLCRNSELAIELGKHLDAPSITCLYRTSRAFHDTVNTYMFASVRAWIAHKAPLAARIFDHRLYKRHLVPDPAGRTWGYQYETEQHSSSSSSQPQKKETETKTEKEKGKRKATRHVIDSSKASEVRAIPGLVYLQLVEGRDRYCREIRAVLARSGHRTPASMHATLLKLWLCMDVPTSAQRTALLRKVNTTTTTATTTNTSGDAARAWSDIDLYNAQLLFVKLGMHFNDPVYGPNTYELLHLILGQRGLYPLWQLLLRKRFTRLAEILALKARYDMQVSPPPPPPPPPATNGGGRGRGRGHAGAAGAGAAAAPHWSREYFGSSIHGVPYAQIGKVHLEGWGRGARHLLRPDELVPVEAVARGLRLDAHLLPMMMWGCFDWRSGANLVPSEAEMAVDDEDAAFACMDTSGHWRARHVLKARFDALSLTERARIRAEDEDERLRAMAWCGEAIDDYVSEDDGDGDGGDDDDDDYSNDDDEGEGEGEGGGYKDVVASINDEMNRGFIVPPLDNDDDDDDGAAGPAAVPALDDEVGWRDFVNNVLMSGLPPDVSGDEALRAEAWQTYHGTETDADWGTWLRERERARERQDADTNTDTDTDTGVDDTGHDGSQVEEEDSEASTVV